MRGYRGQVQIRAGIECNQGALESEFRLSPVSRVSLTLQQELQIALLRSQNRFNLRGIIESIAEQPDYDGTLSPEEKIPSSKRGVQARLDWIIDNSPAYNRFREKIIIHREIRRVDFDRTSHTVYHELSKYFHENRLAADKNADNIVVDMTQDFKKGVFGTLDGAALECFLHYRHIPYTTIYNNVVEQYALIEPWGDLERTVMPADYRQELYDRLLNGSYGIAKVDDNAAKENDKAKENAMETTVSISPA